MAKPGYRTGWRWFMLVVYLVCAGVFYYAEQRSTAALEASIAGTPGVDQAERITEQGDGGERVLEPSSDALLGALKPVIESAPWSAAAVTARGRLAAAGIEPPAPEQRERLTFAERTIDARLNPYVVDQLVLAAWPVASVVLLVVVLSRLVTRPIWSLFALPALVLAAAGALLAWADAGLLTEATVEQVLAAAEPDMPSGMRWHWMSWAILGVAAAFTLTPTRRRRAYVSAPSRSGGPSRGAAATMDRALPSSPAVTPQSIGHRDLQARPTVTTPPVAAPTRSTSRDSSTDDESLEPIPLAGEDEDAAGLVDGVDDRGPSGDADEGAQPSNSTDQRETIDPTLREALNVKDEDSRAQSSRLPSVADRLTELARLRDIGAISPEEYEKHRQRILGEV